MEMMRTRYLLLLSLVVFAALFLSSNPAEIAARVAHADARYVAAGLAVSTLSLLLRVLKWNVLLPGISFRSLFPVQILGMTVSNFTPGKLAEPVKAMLLKAKEGVPVSSSMPSIIWERIIDVAVLLLFASFLVFTVSAEIRTAAIVSVALFAIAIVAGVALIRSRRVGTRLFAMARKLPLMNRISDEFVHSFYRERIRAPHIAQCLVVTLAVWVLDAVTVYCALASVGYPVSPVALAGMMALSTLIGVASFLPGGIGSSEFVFLVLLGGVGVPQAAAFSGILIMRVLTLWYGVLVGYLSFLHLRKHAHIGSVFK